MVSGRVPEGTARVYLQIAETDDREVFPFPVVFLCAYSFDLSMTEVEKAVFYTSAKWKRFRKRVLIRDDYTCQRCKRYGRLTPAREVHHIKHLEEFPELAYDPANCVSLCKGCHNLMHPEKGTKSISKHNEMHKF